MKKKTNQQKNKNKTRRFSLNNKTFLGEKELLEKFLFSKETFFDYSFQENSLYLVCHLLSSLTLDQKCGTQWESNSLTVVF